MKLFGSRCCGAFLPEQASVFPVKTQKKPFLSFCLGQENTVTQMTGVLLPRSGSSTFQRTLFSGLHCVGRLVSAVTLVPSGPRHWGQLSAWQLVEKLAANKQANPNVAGKNGTNFVTRFFGGEA